ncbi:MAG: diguanylate cyclase [Terracidiphilus sp.]
MRKALALRSVAARAGEWLRGWPKARLGRMFVLYAVAAWAGLWLANAPSGSAIIWPANGILLAFLLTEPRRHWAVYLAAAMPANIVAHLFFPYSFSDVFVFTVCNTVEVLLAALVLAPEEGQKPDLSDLRTLGIFVAGCGILAPLASAATLHAVHSLMGQPVRLWDVENLFLGDALGILVMTPLTLAIDRDELASIFGRGRRLGSLGILALLTVLSCLVFWQRGMPIAFLLIPVLLLAILRLGSSGAAIGVFLMAAPGAYFTAQGRGPFPMGESHSQLAAVLWLDAFLWVMILMLYSVSSVLAEKERLRRQLADAARVAEASAGLDYLTGLANRRSFDSMLSREWRWAIRERGSISLLMIDVDRFKEYNDEYGHVAGDLCLRGVAEVLSAAPLRATDMVARFGGDEFALILWRASVEGARGMAERLRQGVEDAAIPHRGNPGGVVTITVGVGTVSPAAGMDEIALIEWADQALYCAKQAGRNRVEAGGERYGPRTSNGKRE